MSPEKYIKIKLKLKSISPVFIGSDDTKKLSPYSDYVQDDNTIKIIDQNKLNELLTKNENLVDEYIKGISSFDESKTRSKFDLKRFIKNKLKIQIDDIKKEVYCVSGETGKTIIYRFINSSGRYFIPGSSLKGAIRTALYYYWLKSNKEGKDFLIKLADEVYSLFSQKQELEKKKINNQLNEIDQKKYNKLKRPTSIKEELSKIFNETNLFGKNEASDARNLKISDSDFIGKVNFSVLKSIRFNLGNANSGIPVWNIVMNQGSESEFEFSIYNSFDNKFFSSFFDNKYSFLFKIMNEFSKDIINNEINVFSNFNNKEIKNKLNSSIEFYKKLLKLIEKSKNEYCIFRLGAGKTYYDNSIGLLLVNNVNLNDEKYNDIFNKFKNLLGIGKSSKYSKSLTTFPITRNFYEIGGHLYPPGWIILGKEIEKIQILDSLYNMMKETNDSMSNNLNKTQVSNIEYILAEIITDEEKPPKVKILEGNHKDKITILPGVRLETFELSKGKKIYVKLHLDKKKNLEKAEFYKVEE